MTSTRAVVVTGGGSGIGRAVAQAFSRIGDQVLVVGRTASTLEETAKGYDTIDTFPADIAAEGGPGRIVAAAVERMGGIDILVNNAGVGRFGGVDQVTPEMLDEQFRTNVYAPTLLTQAALPALEARRGLIVNISSAGALGTRGWPRNSVYWATKSALNSLTRSWALELAPCGIRVLAVAPGVVETEIGAHIGMSEEQYRAFLDDMAGRVPVGRVASPEDVAWWVVQSGVPGAGYACGAVIPVDGGLSLV